MNFSHADHKCRGKSKDIDGLNTDGIDKFNLSCSILVRTAQIMYYQTIRATWKNKVVFYPLKYLINMTKYNSISNLILKNWRGLLSFWTSHHQLFFPNNSTSTLFPASIIPLLRYIPGIKHISMNISKENNVMWFPTQVKSTWKNTEYK